MDRVMYTLSESRPYCWLDLTVTPIRSWVTYADGFGFPVAGFGRSARESRRECRLYAERLAADPEYRESRRALWLRPVTDVSVLIADH